MFKMTCNKLINDQLMNIHIFVPLCEHTSLPHQSCKIYHWHGGIKWWFFFPVTYSSCMYSHTMGDVSADKWHHLCTQIKSLAEVSYSKLNLMAPILLVFWIFSPRPWLSVIKKPFLFFFLVCFPQSLSKAW